MNRTVKEFNIDLAEFDYCTFFRAHPKLKNPTDINCEEKFNFARDIGWERFRAMQNARKRGAAYTRNPNEKHPRQ